MTECSKCGACCERIYLPTWTPEEVAQTAEGNGVYRGCKAIADATFITEHWHGTPDENGAIHYRCDAYDSATHLCTAHDTRPPICQGFPWYSDKPNAHAIWPFKLCSFWLDVPLADWPADVAIDPLSLHSSNGGKA